MQKVLVILFQKLKIVFENIERYKINKFCVKPSTFEDKCPWLSRGNIKGGDAYERFSAHSSVVKCLGLRDEMYQKRKQAKILQLDSKMFRR